MCSYTCTSMFAQCTWANVHTRVCTHRGINIYTHTQMPAVWHRTNDLAFHSPILNTSIFYHQFLRSSAWSMKSSRVRERERMWSYANIQRDTDTEVLHINLIKSAVYLLISGKQAWALQTSESHSKGPKLLFLCAKTSVDVMRREKGQGFKLCETECCPS